MADDGKQRTTLLNLLSSIIIEGSKETQPLKRVLRKPSHLVIDS
jgi:hypothetical protein